MGGASALTGSDAMTAILKMVTGTSDNMDKQKALEAALAQIDRAFGKGSAMKLGSREAVEIETISTGSLGLDIALGIGGVARGPRRGGLWAGKTGQNEPPPPPLPHGPPQRRRGP